MPGGISANSQSKVLSDPKIVAISHHLRELCSRGEYELEMLWAEKVYCCGTQKEGKYTPTLAIITENVS